MKKASFLFLSMMLGCLCSNEACAAGLDEIYRDLVRSDNRGYLPLFVKNREAPKIFDDENILNQMSQPSGLSEQNLNGLEDVNLDNERQRQSKEREEDELRWKKVLKNVQSGFVSSVEIEELTKRERENNPQAVEVLGWIYAKGIGVEPDLIKAFNYYKKGTALSIPQAKENAIKVYKAMTPAQKSSLME